MYIFLNVKNKHVIQAADELTKLLKLSFLVSTNP